MRSHGVSAGRSGISVCGSRGSASCRSAPPVADRHRARHESEPPQELPPRPAERVARARRDERLEAGPVERRPLAQVAHAGERAVQLALGLERLRRRLGEAADVAEPDAHRAALDPALRVRALDVRRAHLHPAPLRVAHEARRRIEAHRLRVQERAQELGRIVVPKPRRLVGEQRERGGVRLGEAERREPEDLPEHELRGLARRRPSPRRRR